MCDTQVQVTNEGTQAVKTMCDVEMSTHMVSTSNACIQMDPQVDEKEISCQIIVPDDDDQNVTPDQKMQCFKCEGTQVNKKGMPCRKCNGTGQIASKALSEISGLIKDEVESFCDVQFRGMLKEYLSEKKAAQEEILHPNFICDECEMNPIKGVRFMCSVCSNYDLC